MNNKGQLLAFGLCCLYPVLFHFVWVFIASKIAQRDWSSIRWHEIKFPWSKDQQ